MSFHLYNSLSGSLTPFKPIKEKEVLLYVCGITPYDTTHLGHAFLYMQIDALTRYLTWLGYTVNYTQNVTDIDDDILKRAKEEKKDWRKLGKFWTDKFLTDLKTLNIHMPTHFVKATDSIDTMITIITKLMKKNHAYEKNGNVYFHVPSFSEYGKLSHYNEKQMLLISKERGANPDDPLKKHPLDFILWQRSAEGEPSWESPWGNGRPGWHIECSAMGKEYLGEQIDIHGGGRDLIYPHHESEIAQMESYSGKKPSVSYWMHAAMVMYQGEKMSKSLGNLVMVSNLLKNYSPNVIRFTLLSHHYRKPWEFEENELDEAKDICTLIQKALQRPDRHDEADPCLHEFSDAMNADLNIPEALEIIKQTAKKILVGESTSRCHNSRALREMVHVLGFSF